MRKTLIAFAALVWLLGVTPRHAHADDAGPIPGLPWVHQGTVITSRWYAANLFRKGLTVTQDDNGEWVGDDGKNYSSSIHQASDAGGLMQTTVLAIDGDNLVLKNTTYTNVLSDPIRRPPDRGGEPRFIAKAVKNNFCEAPDLLAKEASDAQTGRIVRQVTWLEGGQKVDAIRIDKKSAAEWITIVYDRKTGVGLHLASVSQTGSDSGSILLQYDLIGYRDLNIPWRNEPIPQAARDLKSMRLAGQMVQQSPFGVRPISLSVDFTADRATDKWLSINSTGAAIVPGYPPAPASKPELRYYGPGEFGGLWIGPAAAANLSANQVLDDDPATKMKTIVSRIDDHEITIQQSNRSTTAEWTYDHATGLLIGSQWFDAMTKFRTTLQRQSLQ